MQRTARTLLCIIYLCSLCLMAVFRVTAADLIDVPVTLQNQTDNSAIDPRLTPPGPELTIDAIATTQDGGTAFVASAGYLFRSTDALAADLTWQNLGQPMPCFPVSKT